MSHFWRKNSKLIYDTNRRNTWYKDKNETFLVTFKHCANELWYKSPTECFRRINFLFHPLCVVMARRFLRKSIKIAPIREWSREATLQELAKLLTQILKAKYWNRLYFIYYLNIVLNIWLLMTNFISVRIIFAREAHSTL